MKTLLIIGGSGFFGLSLFDYFQNNDNFKKWKLKKIIFISRKINLKRNKLTQKKFQFLREDITNLRKLPKCDLIIYAVNTNKKISNLKAINNFCKIIKRDFEKCNIIFTSSGAVYGKTYSNKYNKIKLFNENISINFDNIKNLPINKKNYAISKIESENILKKIASKKIKISIARCFTFIGPNIIKYKKYFISDLLKSLTNKDSIKIKSNYSVYRSFMDANDLCDWLLTILTKSRKKYDIYNVGSDKKIEIHDLGKKISKIYNLKLQSNKISSSFVDFYVPSIKKAKQNLGLRTETNIDKVIDKTFRYLKFKL